MNCFLVLFGLHVLENFSHIFSGRGANENEARKQSWDLVRYEKL